MRVFWVSHYRGVKNGDGMDNNSILYGNGYGNENHNPKVHMGDRG